MKVEEKLAGYNVITTLENNKKNVGWVNPQDITHQTETVGDATLTPPAITSRETLPIGWLWSTLGEVAHVLAGNPAPQGDEFFAEGKYPFVRVQDMGRLNGAIRIHSTNDCVNEKAVKGLRLFPRGSVLFTKSGASTLLNQRAILGSDMYVVSHIAIAIPKDEILSEWLYFWLRTVDFAYLVHATTLPSLPLSRAKGILIPVAPIDQQKRIVAEIEKQFSRLDEAVANLKRVKANLKRYKAAVLKAAVEGRLVETEAEIARREGRSYESGEQLLQRILETRRNQWKGKGKYKEAVAPDTTDLPELPEGWVWASVNQVAEKVVDGTHHTPKYVSFGVPFISVKDVRDGTIHFNNTKYITSSTHDELIKRCYPEVNDVLITKSGTIGRTAVIATDKAFSLFVSVALIKPIKPVVNSQFLKIALDAYIQSIDISQDIKGGLLKNLHLEDLREIAIPLPPEAEQGRIVSEIESRFSLLHKTDAQVETNLQHADSLRRAILSKAFSC